ncbi:MAG: hypothetical protein A2629_00310 [Candidatus Levybacteria bacterium RIFCSPHIGHO2_01_FULL_41_15]|nr:MAG: hypothetical protein A2629_00310 [Candidatus Levybacteria bacterium RIFCSPHIGHO2_01_FULL_41_15]
MSNLRKLLAIFLVLYLVLGGASSVFAEASEAPEAAEVEEINETEEIPATVPEEAPQQPEENSSNNEVEEIPEIPESDSNPDDPVVSTEGNPEADVSRGTSSDGNVGDTFIDTGDANSDGNIFTTANSNLAGNDDCCASGGIGIVNDGNGSGSTNTSSATVTDTSTTDQSNSAGIQNGLTGASVSGQNSASDNVGDSFINTGDASTTGTIITSANTNIDGVTVAEFNIVDDHTGDYILDFGAGCVSGCDGFTGLAQNSNNGSNSDNDATINSDTTNTTNQANNGTVNNDLYLTADSGDNAASGNTGGDSYVTTGDASVTGNVLTLLNNNLAGNVILGVVNIFGDLIGDIILSESALSAFACATCGGDTTLINSGNGSNSDNNVSSDQIVIDTINQVNVADIDNNLILTANTGGNSASGNTGGDSYITTGNADVTAQVLNIVNNNIVGGNWWLVIINRAGQWIGQIVGAPQGAMFAGSQGTEFAVDENGEITAINSNNGSESTNDAKVYQSTKEHIDQTNNADVNNNIYLSANTGKNSANDNTGGDSYITTGDAKVIVNLVNFVNNNIVGGRLLVTFVNVFGSWMGDFVTPGAQKDNDDNIAGVGGPPQSESLPSNDSNPPSSSPGGGGGSGNSAISGNSVPFVGGVLAGATAGNLFAAASGPSQDSQDTQTLGVNSSEKDNSKKKVDINLAWAFLALPVLGIGFILRKKALILMGRIIK